MVFIWDLCVIANQKHWIFRIFPKSSSFRNWFPPFLILFRDLFSEEWSLRYSARYIISLPVFISHEMFGAAVWTLCRFFCDLIRNPDNSRSYPRKLHSWCFLTQPLREDDVHPFAVFVSCRQTSNSGVSVNNSEWELSCVIPHMIIFLMATDYSWIPQPFPYVLGFNDDLISAILPATTI